MKHQRNLMNNERDKMRQRYFETINEEIFQKCSIERYIKENKLREKKNVHFEEKSIYEGSIQMSQTQTESMGGANSIRN